MDKIARYQQLLANLDRKGHVPIERDEASDAKLADIILQTETPQQEENDAFHNLAAAAIDRYYGRRPITFRTLLRMQDEFERSKEGRALLTLDSSISAFTCQAVAAVSAVTGVYELASLFFAAGTYKAYEAIRMSRRTDDG